MGLLLKKMAKLRLIPDKNRYILTLSYKRTAVKYDKLDVSFLGLSKIARCVPEKICI